ncbi:MULTISPECIES: ROK family protein [Paenibacillus]|jgi:fructokinase|uniref:fructokinase n=1 Tax=Paenibacillus lactis 154 TaxID=743719 RepID=G4HLR6_9BACL|nr:ROK family protein [Paenibacillus lactis]EHB56561.1 ROK family protein [Paenibacillus lactis 154]GIO94464.1 putative fructokinase [Paenibacillus lactis]
MRIGAIEAGGTKFLCGVGNELGIMEDVVHFPTEHPDVTLSRVISYFSEKNVDAIGIGSFGPIDLKPSSTTYGFVTTTPKQGWGHCDVLGKLKKHYDVPYGWDTDVNAAAYGETVWGAAKGLGSCVYITIGTGVGVGVYAEGRLVHGLVHPEGGHVLIRRHPDDQYAGACPYHGDCFEGMAAGPAIEARWGVKGDQLPADHPAWPMEAYYIAQAVAGIILTHSPEKIILGGGVMQQAHLFPLVRSEVQRILNGYVQADEIMNRIEEYIIPPGLGSQAGLYGALALGLKAIQDRRSAV